MGGVKKKSISQVGKAQALDRRKEKKDVKTHQKSKRDVIMPNIDKKQAFKIFKPMRAITIYNTAKALNIKVSVASALLKSLVAKGILIKIGGHSGHTVYTIVDTKSESS